MLFCNLIYIIFKLHVNYMFANMQDKEITLHKQMVKKSIDIHGPKTKYVTCTCPNHDKINIISAFH